MFDNLGILIYLDEFLIKSINSVVSEGYIEIKGSRKILDVAITERDKIEVRDTIYFEERETKDKREGFKGYINADAETQTINKGKEGGLEKRGNLRCEEETKRIYTSYIYHRDFYNMLMQKNLVREISLGTNCTCGQYIITEGVICGNSIISYVEALLLIIEMVGEEEMDKRILDSEIIKAKGIKAFLQKILNKLGGEDIIDIIIEKGKERCVIQVKTSNFFNGECLANANIGCKVKVFGKVLKNNCEKIDLCRKLEQCKFYKETLLKIDKIFKEANLNIEIPKLEELFIKNCLYILPISIFV